MVECVVYCCIKPFKLLSSLFCLNCIKVDYEIFIVGSDLKVLWNNLNLMIVSRQLVFANKNLDRKMNQSIWSRHYVDVIWGCVAAYEETFGSSAVMWDLSQFDAWELVRIDVSLSTIQRYRVRHEHVHVDSFWKQLKEVGSSAGRICTNLPPVLLVVWLDFDCFPGFQTGFVSANGASGDVLQVPVSCTCEANKC